MSKVIIAALNKKKKDDLEEDFVDETKDFKNDNSAA